MPNPADVLAAQQHFTTSESPFLTGVVATPAPASFSDDLWVLLPEFSTERPLGPCQWKSEHGATLPAVGAKVVVVLDDDDVPTVIWWAGEYS